MVLLRKIFMGVLCLVMLNSLTTEAQVKAENKEIIVKMDHFFRPNNPESAYTRQLINFMRLNPKIKIQKWGGIALPGGG